MRKSGPPNHALYHTIGQNWTEDQLARAQKFAGFFKVHEYARHQSLGWGIWVIGLQYDLGVDGWCQP